LYFNVRLKEIFSYEKFTEEQKKAQIMDAKTEKELLDAYLKDANISVKPTASGLYFVEYTKGKGSFPVKGQKVTIHYTGSFINGEVFDSSLKRGEAFTFDYGANQVIPGMEEGIGKMKAGGKATVIIPSELGYGKEQFQMIPPFSTLIFEIELLSIK
jgi:FKBP-type peptidyl-prolyl cis-trans isomerase FkpA/FKBP-type peptidyl-prolyl cis-trans isomerase FklB